MEHTFSISYHPEVVEKDIPKLNGAWKKKIQKALEQKLMANPAHYGAPLRKNLSGLFRLRVGDYRVIYRIRLQASEVQVIVIEHRSTVYTKNHHDRL